MIPIRNLPCFEPPADQEVRLVFSCLLVHKSGDPQLSATLSSSQLGNLIIAADISALVVGLTGSCGPPVDQLLAHKSARIVDFGSRQRR